MLRRLIVKQDLLEARRLTSRHTLLETSNLKSMRIPDLQVSVSILPLKQHRIMMAREMQ